MFSDMKGMNSSALNLFRCGHIQQITVCYRSDQKQLCIKANCMPEMRKDRVYHLTMVLNLESSDIVGAECGCPAGKGPHASCKHIGGLCFALEEFSRIGKTPEYSTCTDKLQQWNKPHPKKLDILPVASLSSRREEILLKEKKVSPLVTFDPRPIDQRKIGDEVVEKFRCDLLSLKEPPAFLDSLVPSVEKIKHDHTYSQLPSAELEHNVNLQPLEELVTDLECNVNIPSYTLDDETVVMCAVTKASLNVSSQERERIEVETRGQSSQKEWYTVRAKRITGSKCGKILCQKKKYFASERLTVFISKAIRSTT